MKHHSSTANGGHNSSHSHKHKSVRVNIDDHNESFPKKRHGAPQGIGKPFTANAAADAIPPVAFPLPGGRRVSKA